MKYFYTSLLGTLFITIFSFNTAHAAIVYSPGCTSANGYSMTTGARCTAGVVLGESTDAGCTTGTNYSKVSGKLCPSAAISTAKVLTSRSVANSLTVTSPSTGSIYQVGQQITINWTSTGYGPNSILAIDLVKVNPDTSHTNTFLMSVSNLANDGTETLTIPTNVPAASNYGIHMSIYDPATTLWQDAFSPGMFTILTSPTTSCTLTSPPSIKVLSPNGGEVYQAGQQITVSWSSCNISASDLVDIVVQHHFPQGGGIGGANYSANLNPNGGGTINDGTEIVILPTQYSGRPFGTYFKILVIKHPYSVTNTINDISDNLFTINNSQTCTINSFIANPSTILSGAASQLSWSTTGCTTASISHSEAIATPLPPSGVLSTSVFVGIPYTYPYILKASSMPGCAGTTYSTASGQLCMYATQSIMVNIATPVTCTIDSFMANPTAVTSGSTAMLSWDTTNCSNVTINGISGTFAADGTRTTGPVTATKTYLLTARSMSGECLVGATSGPNSCPTRKLIVPVTTVPIDYCINIPGTQSSVPAGMIVNQGSCIGITVDYLFTMQQVNVVPGANNDYAVFNIRFSVTANGSDIYLDKTVIQSITGLADANNHAAIVTNNGALATNTMTLNSAGPNAIEMPNTFKVLNGQSAVFNVTMASIPNMGTIRGVLYALQWGLSDTAAPLGNVYTTNMGPDGIYKTPYVTVGS